MCLPASAGFVSFQVTAVHTWWGVCPRLISLDVMVSTDESSGLLRGVEVLPTPAELGRLPSLGLVSGTFCCALTH